MIARNSLGTSPVGFRARNASGHATPRKRLLAGMIMTCCLWTTCGGGSEEVWFIKSNGAISPATSGCISRAVKEAAVAKAQCLMVQLDTPGGLLDSTKTIVQTFYGSAVPVVVYVAPAGAGATNAGCFITLTADVAAMAPSTTIGVAHPVAIGSSGGAEKLDEVMKQELENSTVGYIEATAQKHGRNVAWAKEAVRLSASITAEDALASNVVEIIAKNVPDLVWQLNDRTVKERVLKTADATVQESSLTARERRWRGANP